MWLVTGGAGYIGSHIVKRLLADNQQCVVIDDLSTGDERRVPDDVPLMVASVDDIESVYVACEVYKVTGIIHCAAKINVGESMEHPLMYWKENVQSLMTLLDALSACRTPRTFIFSSSAAVYGVPPAGRAPVITEDTECLPVNPYGWTKLVGEKLIEAYALANGWRAVSLRYFNVAGAAEPHLADSNKFHVMPAMMDAIREGKPVKVFGSDYDTPDGTCVRDYVHPTDIAEAHFLAAKACESGKLPVGNTSLNLGTGVGVSVRDVMKAIYDNGRTTDWLIEPAARRDGDPPMLVASPWNAMRVLGWGTTKDLDDIVRDAWAAHEYRYEQM